MYMHIKRVTNQNIRIIQIKEEPPLSKYTNATKPYKMFLYKTNKTQNVCFPFFLHGKKRIF